MTHRRYGCQACDYGRPAVLLLALLSLAGPAHAREMLVGGDFERGKSAFGMWHCKGSGNVGVAYSTSKDTRPGSPGKRSLQIDTTDDFACSNWIYKLVYGLEGGKKYRMSIWYKIVANDSLESVIARDQKNDTNQDRKDLHFDMTVDGKWKQISAVFTAHESTTPKDYYRLAVNPVPRGKGGAGGIVRVDDFSLWDLDPSLPPAPKPQASVMAKLLKVDAGGKAKNTGGAEAGVLDGYPYLRNERVIYLWAKPENGGGLFRMHDLRSGKQILKIDQGQATFWKVDAKNKAGNTLTFENASVPYKVSFDATDGEAELSFDWRQANMHVKVQTRLKAGESLARSRMAIETKLGLQTVFFPVIAGIAPMTEGAKNDKVLGAHRRGQDYPSPLVTKKQLRTHYAVDMNLQMGAMYGDGVGLYFGEEDEQANEKYISWTPDEKATTLTYAMEHPVLGWGGDEPVTTYASPGDVVMGPFEGDWFDAARIYRKWAITAPWCRKGLIHQREDYPQWLARLPYWSVAGLQDKESIDKEFVVHDFFDMPESLCHSYYYTFGFVHHDRNPEYLPPRIGSENLKAVLAKLRMRGVRAIPYYIGWLWNMTTESYRTEEAEKSAIIHHTGDVIWTWAGGDDPQAAMCPYTPLWRNKVTEVTKEYITQYGYAGVYYDYFTAHQANCFAKNHGHPLAGGNYWSSSVHGLYEQVRAEAKKLDPEFMMCGEMAAEWAIDVLDTAYEAGPESDTPIFLAVYHGYTQIFSGGLTYKHTPPYLGRQWLMGCQNGWLHQEYAMATSPEPIYKRVGPWYKSLIRCHWELARPYLGYGEMMRPPKIKTAKQPTPTILSPGVDDPMFPVNIVEGSAWLASDGSVGLFFLNYDDFEDHQFTWSINLNEIAKIGPDKKLKVTQWIPGDNGGPGSERIIGEWRGGVIGTTTNLESWGIMALKLEVVQ